MEDNGITGCDHEGVAARVESFASDEDWISLAEQRRLKAGPDYDPFYSDKLESYFQEQLGPLGEFQPNS